MLFTLFTLLKVNADFQMDPSKNYEEKDLPGQANPAICGAQITQRYGVFAATLEQPFKDTASEFPNAETGWSAKRSVFCWGRRCWTVLVRCCERGGREGVVCMYTVCTTVQLPATRIKNTTGYN